MSTTTTFAKRKLEPEVPDSSPGSPSNDNEECDSNVPPPRNTIPNEEESVTSLKSRRNSSQRSATRDSSRRDESTSKTEQIPNNSQESTPRSNFGDSTSIKPRISCLPRPFYQKSNVPSKSSLRTPSSIGSNAQKRNLEKQFLTKRNRYVASRKELSEKQRHAIELYEEVSQLRDKLLASGSKDPGKIEKILLVRDKNTAEEKKSEKDANDENTNASKSVVDGDFLAKFESKVNDVPKEYANVCREALARRTDIIGWLTDFSHEQEERRLDPEISKQFQVYRTEGLALEEKLQRVTKEQKEVLGELLRNTTLLWNENEACRIRMRKVEASEEDLVRDFEEKIRAIAKEVEEEREKCTRLRERKVGAESQIQKMKLKIKDLENRVNGEEVKNQHLRATVKSLETQLKQKDNALEAKTKELLRFVKVNEGIVAKAEKQREILESRLTEVKDELESGKIEWNETISRLRDQLEETTTRLNSETDSRNLAEAELTELRERCGKLEQKSQQLCDLAEKTRELILSPVTDGTHTENELHLWNELRVTRKTLIEKEEQLLQLQRQKNEIVGIMQQAVSETSSDSVKEKLAVDLISKTEGLQLLSAQNCQLRKNLKIAQDKCSGVERQLVELQDRIRAKSDEGGEAGWNARSMELRQQVTDLGSSLGDLKRRNEELETDLIRKQLELEQRDIVMKEQSKVLKVRDELIDILKRTSFHNSVDRIDESGNPVTKKTSTSPRINLDPEMLERLVSEQIAAKAEDLRSLYDTLEKKQIQLMRLEKVVRQMEEDNDRSQATRTKLEKEVAHLRIQLHDKTHRARTTGFGFV